MANEDTRTAGPAMSFLDISTDQAAYAAGRQDALAELCARSTTWSRRVRRCCGATWPDAPTGATRARRCSWLGRCSPLSKTLGSWCYARRVPSSVRVAGCWRVGDP
jgi:hypothetical protein